MPGDFWLVTGIGFYIVFQAQLANTPFGNRGNLDGEHLITVDHHTSLRNC